MELIKRPDQQLTKVDTAEGKLPAIVFSDLPSIKKLTFEKGKEVVVGDIYNIAISYLEMINLEAMPTERQLVVIISEMINDFPAWKMPDFDLFFKGIAKTEYGKIYGRLDMQVIYEFAKIHEGRRMDLLEDKKTRVEYVAPEEANISDRDISDNPFYANYLNRVTQEKRDYETYKAHAEQWEAELKKEWEELLVKFPTENPEVKDMILINGKYESYGNYRRGYIRSKLKSI